MSKKLLSCRFMASNWPPAWLNEQPREACTSRGSSARQHSNGGGHEGGPWGGKWRESDPGVHSPQEALPMPPSGMHPEIGYNDQAAEPPRPKTPLSGRNPGDLYLHSDPEGLNSHSEVLRRSNSEAQKPCQHSDISMHSEKVRDDKFCGPRAVCGLPALSGSGVDESASQEDIALLLELQYGRLLLAVPLAHCFPLTV